MDIQRLNERVAGRNAAGPCVELMLESCDALTTEGEAAFWEEVRDKIEELLPKRSVPKPTMPDVIPMTASEAVEFEKEQMPFGKFHGQSVASIFSHTPDYLEWCAGLDFTDKLRRYLANEQIASRIEGDEDE